MTLEAERRLRGDVLAALFCVALALWTYRPVLGNFFSPDDLVLWEWTRGLSPPPATLWRFIPGRLYFGWATHVFGIHPLPYFVINWLLHGIDVALLYVFARRLGADALGATLTAGLFGTSRLLLSTVGQVVGIGDLLALCFVLVASIAMTFPGRRAIVVGTFAFSIALLSKEIVVGLPLSLLFAPSVGRSVDARLRKLAPLFGAGVLWLLYLGVSGARASVFGGGAYEARLGTNLFDSILMYAQWSADLMSIAPDYGAERPGHSWPAGIWVLVVFVLVAWAARRRSSIPWIGFTWWLSGLAPVLPLVFQKHLHYLYSPWVGVALWVGSLPRLLLDRKGSGAGIRLNARLAWSAALLLVGAHAALSESLILRRYRERMPEVDLPADTFVRKMEVARRAMATVRAGVGDRHTRLAFYNPLIRGEPDFYAYVLPAVLDDGRALRALNPNIDSVLFVRRWVPQLTGFEIVVANEDARVLVIGRGPEANLRLIRMLGENGYEREAADLLLASVEAYPTDRGLLDTYAKYMTRRRPLTPSPSPAPAP